MKKFLRRSGAALLAACTVWTLIVTVESRSVPAALAAMRSSFPVSYTHLDLYKRQGQWTPYGPPR